MHRNIANAKKYHEVFHISSITISLSGVRTTGLLPRGMKREVGFFFACLFFTNSKEKQATYRRSRMFTTATLSCLSGPTGETKSPKSLQPCAGHPEAVQEESGEFWMFLEVLCLNLSTGIEATRETGLALKQTSLSCTHTSTCRQNKKHRACIPPYVRTCTASCMCSHIHSHT